MRFYKNIPYLVFVVFLMISCIDNRNGTFNVITDLQHKADSLNLHYYYTDAKWKLYCNHCDDSCYPFFPSIPMDSTVTFGTLDLRYKSFLMRSDTIEYYFNFYYEDVPCSINSHVYGGVCYVLGAKNYLYALSYGTFNYIGIYYEDSRLQNPLQPEVVDYIKKNKNKIDPWFRKEAIKRGIIKE